MSQTQQGDDTSLAQFEDDLVDYNEVDEKGNPIVPPPRGTPSPVGEEASHGKAPAPPVGNEESTGAPPGACPEPNPQPPAPEAEDASQVHSIRHVDDLACSEFGDTESWTTEMWEKILRKEILQHHSMADDALNTDQKVNGFIEQITRRFLDPPNGMLFPVDVEDKRHPLKLELYKRLGIPLVGIHHLIPPTPSSDGSGSHSTSPFLLIHERRLAQLLDMETVLRTVQKRSPTTS